MPQAQLLPIAPDSPPPDLAGVEVAFISRDLFVGGTRHRLTPRFLHFTELLKIAPALRWVQTFSAGTDMQTYQDMLARGLLLTNSAGASATAVAQTAITGLLALARGLPRIAEAQLRRAWEPLYAGAEPRDTDGQRALVLGTGPIGQEFARLARPFGLHLTGIRREPEAGIPPHFDAVAGFADLPALLPQSPWLILACPLTDTTRGIIGTAALAAMPPASHLINVARGGVADEAAVLAALRSGQLAGAFLDVFTMEPLPPDSPFWVQPNVIVSPHSAAASNGLPERIAAIFADNLQRWAAGEPLHNLAHR